MLESAEEGAHGEKWCVVGGARLLGKEGQRKKVQRFRKKAGNLDEKATRAIGSVRFGLGCFGPKIDGGKAWASNYFGQQTMRSGIWFRWGRLTYYGRGFRSTLTSISYTY